MGKAPAFQLYADDFLAGTITMTNAQVGAYIRMLCVQWNKGSVPSDEKKIRRIVSDLDSDDLSEVLEKFELTDEGYKNPRLERVREVMQARSKSGSAGGSKRQANVKQSAKQTSSKPSSKTQANRQANGQAKLKPPSPSPSPSPSPFSKPIPTTNSGVCGTTHPRGLDRVSSVSIPEEFGGDLREAVSDLVEYQYIRDGCVNAIQVQHQVGEVLRRLQEHGERFCVDAINRTIAKGSRHQIYWTERSEPATATSLPENF